jgi:hypothetical protein
MRTLNDTTKLVTIYIHIDQCITTNTTNSANTTNTTIGTTNNIIH